MIVASVLSCFVPWTLNSLGAFPVYHDAKNIVTMRKSLEALQEGEQIVICPDIDYASTLPSLEEMYQGYLHLGTLYSRATGKDLPFVPAYCSQNKRRIVFGPAVYLDNTLHTMDAQKQAADDIRNGVNALGVACGDILTDE